MEVSYYYFKQYCLFCLLYLWTMGKKELKDKQRRQGDIGANFQVWSIIVFITSMAAPNYWLRINLFIFLVHGNFNQLWAVATPCLLILGNYFTQFVRKRNIYNRGKYPMKCWSVIYWVCYLTLISVGYPVFRLENNLRKYICGELLDLVPFIQFQKREKTFSLQLCLK